MIGPKTDCPLIICLPVLLFLRILHQHPYSSGTCQNTDLGRQQIAETVYRTLNLSDQRQHRRHRSVAHQPAAHLLSPDTQRTKSRSRKHGRYQRTGNQTKALFRPCTADTFLFQLPQMCRRAALCLKSRQHIRKSEIFLQTNAKLCLSLAHPVLQNMQPPSGKHSDHGSRRSCGKCKLCQRRIVLPQKTKRHQKLQKRSCTANQKTDRPPNRQLNIGSKTRYIFFTVHPPSVKPFCTKNSFRCRNPHRRTQPHCHHFRQISTQNIHSNAHCKASDSQYTKPLKSLRLGCPIHQHAVNHRRADAKKHQPRTKAKQNENLRPKALKLANAPAKIIPQRPPAALVYTYI